MATNATTWDRLASKLSNKINTAWWLQTLNPIIVVVAILAACGILLLRRAEITLSNSTGIVTSLGIALLSSLAAWLLARRHFQSKNNALVRLEDRLELNNSLTSAQAGVSEWPEIPDEAKHGYSWNWTRLLLPITIAFACLLASFLIPVSPSKDASVTQQPRAWEELENDLTKLSEEDVVEEEYIEEMKKKLEELQSQKEEDWFSHSSLEATDSLKDAHKREIKKNERNLRQISKTLKQLENNKSTSSAQRQRLMDQLGKLKETLQNSPMMPNKELLQQLEKAGSIERLDGLSKEQMEQLKENLQQSAESMSQQMGGSQSGEGDWIDQLMQDGQNGDGQGQCENGNCGGCENCDGDGEQPGKGGVNRGPGTSPQVLGQESKDFKVKKLEGIKSRDLSNTLPGDLLEMQDGEHDVDQTNSGIRAGGAVQSTGDGGNRVWKDSLLPDEQKALKNFFE